MRRLAFSAFLLTTFFSTPLRADWWPVHALPGTRVTAELSAIYDDNPFKYSSKDLEEFDAGGRPYRFPIQTSDDLAFRASLGLELDLGNTRIELRSRGYQYLSNPIKSYQVFSAALSRKLGSSLEADLRYTFLPDYMIRYYPVSDSGPRVYLPCTFSEHLWEIELSMDLGRLGLSALVELGLLDYNRSFEHYDTDLWGIGGSLTYRFTKTLYSRLEYEFRDNSAAGADLANRTDLSNDRHTAKILFRKRRFLWPSLDLGLSLQYRLRVFTTNKPYTVDPFHSGREDSEYRGALTLDYELNRRLTISGQYALEVRSTSSPAKPDIDEVKDYTRSLGSLGLQFTL